ncbi:MAG: hypothetical protein MR283_05860 [Erysipelotrichaceae bacterium]|nr:hypothetical protein [Erysipelotrichaceae bacterium]MDY6035083.1 hypothetical protein [Bulleidia sp.]
MENRIRQIIHHIVLELIGIVLVSIGGAGIMKIALGTGPYDALSMSISSITAIRIGTIGLINNFICVALQMILLKREYKPIYLLQIPVSFLIGWIINLFYYTIFASMNPSLYVVRLLLLFVFIIICAYGDAMVTASGFVGLALESACMIFAKRLNIEFGKIRQYADVIFIAIICVLWLLFRAEFAMREGTIILAITFGPLLGFFTKHLNTVFQKWIYDR